MLQKMKAGLIAEGLRHSKSWKSLLAGFLVAGATCGVAIGIAWATPGQGISTTIIAGPTELDEVHLNILSETNHVKIKTTGLSDVYVVKNTIVPGGHTGWHSHPGISFVTVKTGTATEYHGDDPTTPHTYAAGTGFTEEAGGVHIIRNQGTTDLQLVAFQIIPFGAVRRIDEPAP